MKIRQATLGDVLGMVRLGERFHSATILKDVAPYDPDSMSSLISLYISNEDCVALVLETESKEVVGGIMGILVPLYWNTRLLAAQQVAWFVEPSNRSLLSLILFKRFEAWAKEKGANVIFGGSKMDERNHGMTAFFRRKGYSPLDLSYVKRVN